MWLEEIITTFLDELLSEAPRKLNLGDDVTGGGL